MSVACSAVWHFRRTAWDWELRRVEQSPGFRSMGTNPLYYFYTLTIQVLRFRSIRQAPSFRMMTTKLGASTGQLYEYHFPEPCIDITQTAKFTISSQQPRDSRQGRENPRNRSYDASIAGTRAAREFGAYSSLSYILWKYSLDPLGSAFMVASPGVGIPATERAGGQRSIIRQFQAVILAREPLVDACRSWGVIEAGWIAPGYGQSHGGA